MTLETAKNDPKGALLVFGAGANQVPILEACRRRDWTTIAVDRNPDAPGASLASRFVCQSLRDTNQIREALESERIVGVVARVTDHEAVEGAARLARERGLRGPCPQLVEASTHKQRLAEHCARAKVSSPRRFDPNAEITAKDFPVIVRPDVTIRGKAGIRRVHNKETLQEVLADVCQHSGNERIDISTWVEGADVSVLAHFDGGNFRPLARWDEWVALDEGDRIQGVGVAMPSIVEGDSSATTAIERCLTKLARAFPASQSLVVVSLRIDLAGDVQVIEIHLGVGGDGIAEQLLPAALPGWDVLTSWLDEATGTPIAPPPHDIRPSALIRDGARWQLVSAPDAESLRGRALVELPKGWLAPWALRKGASE